MTSSQKEFLDSFGWDDFFQSQVPTMFSETQFIGRVINEEKRLYRVQFGKEEITTASVTGKMQFDARTRSDYPAVGDWVLMQKDPGDSRAVIQKILKRKTILQRKKLGEVSEIQILAVNVDYVFIMTSLNGDFNPGRLERYLTFAWESKATPVVLLSKSDLCEDLDQVFYQINERFIGVDVFAVSSKSFGSTTFFEDYLPRGKTGVIVGSSGVGKSTLSNYLIGENIIETQEIRSDDDKGKHTTTARSMYKIFYGGLVIDSPGIRELQFSSHEDGLDHLFSDVEELKLKCRFNNCQHKLEEGCAILEALENGQLMASRWKSYNKLQGEIRHEMRKQHQWVMAQDRKAWKKRTMENRKKFKGQH